MQVIQLLILILIFLLPASAQKVKVGIFENITRAYVSADRDFEVEDSNKQVLMAKKAGDRVLFRSSPGALNSLVIASEPELNTSSLLIHLKCTEEPCTFTVKLFQGDKNYFNKFRGEIIIQPNDKTNFTVINNLELEDYLLGVVPGEMPVVWPLEALKAQAVAARTYTIKNLARRKSLGFDLKAGVEDQMYKGKSAEQFASTKAVKDTAGIYMQDKQGLVLDAFYSSHAGKFSASPENAWGLSPKHYLVPVKEAAGAFPWQLAISSSDLSQKLVDLGIGEIKAVTITQRSMEGRATRVLVSGNSGHRLLTGEEFRHQLGLKSTAFDLHKEKTRLVFSGFGFGHGIGMSQHGAKALAEEGLDYNKILEHYYSEAKFSLPN